MECGSTSRCDPHVWRHGPGWRWHPAKRLLYWSNWRLACRPARVASSTSGPAAAHGSWEAASSTERKPGGETHIHSGGAPHFSLKITLALRSDDQSQLVKDAEVGGQLVHM